MSATCQPAWECFITILIALFNPVERECCADKKVQIWDFPSEGEILLTLLLVVMAKLDFIPWPFPCYN